ncbi:hypothetical protein J3L16_10750 [Alteromonas sp. 5E99-2]|uniref:hypothetical protein n=1 Tax=Alteromonas sp. 5E99-2 TaxID=2817683 RepID=UPI001A9906DF|nr:hypothetical protein [Alteromonas sp. 5E99-2]MBO1256162.1 hypothetical protein [Alteromonas sp. 5E99-2]
MPDETIGYKIRQREKGNVFTVYVTDLPVGIDFKLTTSALVKSAKGVTFQLADLANFFLHGKDEELLEVITAAIKPSLLRSLLLFAFTFKFTSPNITFLRGFHEALVGEPFNAIKLLTTFINEESKYHTSVSRAMMHFILGTLYERVGEEKEAYVCFDEAYYFYDAPKYLSALQKRNLPIKDYHLNLVGNVLAADYSLPNILKSTEIVSLSQRLESLKGTELHTICFLGAYRSNQPYEHFLCRYYAYACLQPEIFKSIDIITENKELRPDWLEVENKLISKGFINSILLDDKEQTLSDTIGFTVAPFVIVLDKTGLVHYQGTFDVTRTVIDMLDALTLPVNQQS